MTDTEYAFPFLARQVHELSGATAGTETVGTVFDHEVHLITESLFVERTVRVEWSNER